MKVIYKLTLTVLLLTGAVFAVWLDEIQCDYHNTKAFFDRFEYPNGKCYKVYTHPVWKDGKRYIHSLSTPCR